MRMCVDVCVCVCGIMERIKGWKFGSASVSDPMCVHCANLKIPQIKIEGSITFYVCDVDSNLLCMLPW